MTSIYEALRFGVRGDNGAARKPKDREFYYRIELPDGREALIVAESVTVEHGALVARTEGNTTLVLAPGTWCSAYVCEALFAYDSWSILSLADPEDAKEKVTTAARNGQRTYALGQK
jgi:hypothetical protein